MTGVFGYCNANMSTSEIMTRLAHMGEVLRHSSRAVIETAPAGSHAAFGRVGLGLLNADPQPVSNTDGTVLLCLTGEFYHQEAAKSQMLYTTGQADDDARLALAVYLRDGARGLSQLDGAFTLCIWDERQQELIIVNDRYGLYQHFFAHSNGAFCFAPEMKGVLAAALQKPKLDMTAIAQYIRFQQVLGERSWVEHIQLIAPASIMRYRPADDQLQCERYWDWHHIRPHGPIGFDDAVDETIQIFQRAIQSMTRSPLRLGVYLSGGLDSRTILGFIPEDIPVTTVTYGDAECRDALYAAKLARRARRPHQLYPFSNGQWILDHVEQHLALTEGFHSWMHMHGISTLAPASKLIDVNLSGWDGGTTMGGRVDEYDTDALYRHPRDEASLCQLLYHSFCQKFAWPGLLDQEADALLVNKSLNDAARESFAQELARTAHYDSVYRPDYFYILQHVRRSTQNMIVFQRSTFEVRCPFFDYQLINFLYSLPEHVFARPDFHRSIITRRMPALALVPHDKTNQIPHNNWLLRTGYRALQRGKRAVNRVVGPVFPDRSRLYADYEQYLRSELRAWAEAILFDKRSTERGLYHTDQLRSLWERHVRGDQLWTIGKIAPLITLELVIRSIEDNVGQGSKGVE